MLNFGDSHVRALHLIYIESGLQRKVIKTTYYECGSRHFLRLWLMNYGTIQPANQAVAAQA